MSTVLGAAGWTGAALGAVSSLVLAVLAVLEQVDGRVGVGRAAGADRLLGVAARPASRHARSSTARSPLEATSVIIGTSRRSVIAIVLRRASG